MNVNRVLLWVAITVSLAASTYQMCTGLQSYMDLSIRAAAHKDTRTVGYAINKDTVAAYQDGLQTGIRQERQKHGEPTTP